LELDDRLGYKRRYETCSDDRFTFRRMPKSAHCEATDENIQLVISE
jgi:hypothetical protein